MPLDVLIEDNHCLAVCKPAGLLTQAPADVPSLEAMVRDYLKAAKGTSGNVYLGIPHRLDRPVSGVVLFAKTSKAAQRLAEQFRDRTVRKTYWGLVEGAPPGAGEWRDWIRKLPAEARSEIVSPDSEGAKEAVLEYRVLQSMDGGSLVEFTPLTGRMHQIRIQAASRGHPLWGDSLYGATRPFGPAAEIPRDRLIALHARRLTFLHPIRYEPVEAAAPLPDGWPAADSI